MVKISKILSDKSRGIKITKPEDYIFLSRQGLSVKQLKAIQKITAINTKQLSKILSVSERQLNRYSKDKILKQSISAHIIQILELYYFGFEVFEDKGKFLLWMDSNIQILGSQKPFDLLDTPFGIDHVKTILGRIEYGVYS